MDTRHNKLVMFSARTALAMEADLPEAERAAMPLVFRGPPTGRYGGS